MYNDKVYGKVKEMLQTEGWEILNDPYTIRIKKLKFAIDLEVRRGNVTALVEIKSFLNKGFLEDFYAARGKYQTYQDALRATGNNTPLFLALPYNTFKKHFTNLFIRTILEEARISLLVFNPQTNKITWKR